MDLFLLIVILILIFFIYYFGKIISDLQYDVKNMSNKCIMSCSAANNSNNGNNSDDANDNKKPKKEKFENDIKDGIKSVLEYAKYLL